MVRKVVNFFGLVKDYIVCDICKQQQFQNDEEQDKSIVYDFILQKILNLHFFRYHCWKCTDYDICYQCKKK